MTELLTQIDEAVLLFVNGNHSSFFDTVMWWISNRWFWIPFYCFLATMLYRTKGWRYTLMALLTIGLLITLADQTCATFIRPSVARLRPSNLDNPLSAMIHIVNDYRGGGYGFPSCHAANCTALAVFLSMQFNSRKWTILLSTWAIIVCYSRMYLGVHYPTDLLAGATIGGLYAALLAYAMRFAITTPAIYGRVFGRT